MKVTCSNCNAEVDVQGNVANCPYCGNQLDIQNAGEGIDNYFDNVAPAQPQPSDAYAQSVEKNDKKLKKAVKNVFSWAVFLLIIGLLRLCTGLVSLQDIESLEAQLPDLVGTIYYDPICSYLSLSTAEIIMHVLIAVCGIVLVVFATKLKKTDIYSKDLQSVNLKVFITSCVMAVILLAYFIVEICVASTTGELVDIELIEDTVMITILSSLVWTVLLVVGGVLCVVESVKLAKQAKKN